MQPVAYARSFRSWRQSRALNGLAVVAVLSCLFNLPSAAIANPFDPVRGSWRGAVQLETTASGDAHSVGMFELHVGSDGQIDGVHANGCKLSGVIAFQSQALYRLDARMQGCSFSLFNRRWNGHVTYRQDQHVLTISAMSSDIGPDRKIRQFDFGGTLQR